MTGYEIVGVSIIKYYVPVKSIPYNKMFFRKTACDKAGWPIK